MGNIAIIIDDYKLLLQSELSVIEISSSTSWKTVGLDYQMMFSTAPGIQCNIFRTSIIYLIANYLTDALNFLNTHVHIVML